MFSFTKAELVPIICHQIKARRKMVVMLFSSSPLNQSGPEGKHGILQLFFMADVFTDVSS